MYMSFAFCFTFRFSVAIIVTFVELVLHFDTLCPNCKCRAVLVRDVACTLGLCDRNLAYLHRSPNQNRITVKASRSAILIPLYGGRAQIPHIRQLHRIVLLPNHTLVHLLGSCMLEFIDATELLRRARCRELCRPWCVPGHEVEPTGTSLVEEHRQTGRQKIHYREEDFRDADESGIDRGERPVAGE